MRIREILQTKGSDVVVIAPESSVRDLVALLKEHNLGAVIVSTDGRTMAGIVSERDVVRRLAPRRRPSVRRSYGGWRATQTC